MCNIDDATIITLNMQKQFVFREKFSLELFVLTFVSKKLRAENYVQKFVKNTPKSMRTILNYNILKRKLIEYWLYFFLRHFSQSSVYLQPTVTSKC